MDLEPWVEKIFAHPINKSPADPREFRTKSGLVDARVYLAGSVGFDTWLAGQDAYEEWISKESGYGSIEAYKEEIAYDACIYDRFNLDGRVLDVGGGAGTTREFLGPNVQYLSIDPIGDIERRIGPGQRKAYTCLEQLPNYICATAEFLPVRCNAVDWVHMRSMLDHVHLPDLALLEARRVLKVDGRLLVGLTVEGGRDGSRHVKDMLRDLVRHRLPRLGVKRWADHHTWHPSYDALVNLLKGAGFTILDEFWQPHWKGKVVYLLCTKVDDAIPAVVVK